MIDRIKNNYLWAVLVLSLLGCGAAYLSSEAGLVSERINILSSSGTSKTISTIKPAPSAWIWNIASTFLFSLAISVFISVFVIKRLDKAIATEKENELENIRKAINVDVFDSLFRTLVPSEIFEVFKSDVISNKIVRKNANWIYDFKETGKGEEIELTQTIKYELHNVGHETVNDAISATFDGHGLGSGIRRAVCMFEGQEVVSFNARTINRTPPDQEETTHSDCNKVTITRTPDGYSNLLINAQIPPGKKVDVTVVYVTVYDHFYVNDGYFTKYPMINATLMATYPDTYEFEIFQALSSELKRTLMEDNRQFYEVVGGILPHQGFIYSLKKKTTEKEPDEVTESNDA